MILLVDPSALGGLAGPVDPAPGSAAPDRPPTAIMSAPCQQRALEERRAALARPFVLAELHAEASAIRRDERILGDVPCDDALIVLTRATSGAECRFIGLSGQPTCPGTTRLACQDSGSCQSQSARGPRHVLPDPV